MIQSLGFVEFVKDLTPDLQQMLKATELYII